MCIRIQLNRATVKALHSRLQHAYQGDDVRLVRRITVLIDLLVRQVPMAVLSTFRELSLCRHVHREFMRSTWLDLISIMSTTV